MRVRFNEPTLTNDLRDLGIAVWGNERPSTLLWVVTGGMNQQEILGLDGDPEILSIIEQRVKRRGIVMVYPLLDLTDSMSLHPSDISGGFLQAIIDASRRYPADSILAGGVDSPAPGIWTAHWIAYINGESFTWDAQGDIPAMVIDEGIDGLADFLAARFIQTEITEQREVSISIININNVDQYAQALKYLESLSFVTRVNVKSAVNGEIIFNLQSHGGCPALSKAINIGRRLEPLAGADCERYRLLPEP